MPGVSLFLGMRIVEEILSADQRSRALICEREDGLFTFVEERNAAEPPSWRWERYSGGHSLFDSAEAVVRDVRGRMGWLRREMAWPARDEPPVTVTPRPGGVIDCPACGITFFIKDPARWGGGRHLTCGQRIGLTEVLT
jgi:hypothetical protein